MDSLVATRAGTLILQIDRRMDRMRALAYGHSLLRQRLTAGALLVTLVVAGKFAIQNLLWWADLARDPGRLDYGQYRESAILGLRYGWNHLYDIVAQQRVYAEQVATQPGMANLVWFPNDYTPPMSWLAVPFAVIPAPIGYVIWAALLFAATAFAFLTLAPGSWLAKVTQFALAICPFLVIFSLAETQVTSLQLAAVAAAWIAFRRHRDGWAGIALVTLVLKPQTLLLVPLALVAAGRIRAFGAWFVASAAIGAVVLASIGFDGSIAYLHRLTYANSHPGEFLVGGVYMWAPHFTTGRGRLAAQGLVVALTLFLAWRYRRNGVEVPLAVGLIGSLLTTPFLHINDMITLFPAGWLILRARPQLWMWALASAGYVVVLLCSATGTVRWGEVLVLTEVSALVLLALIPLPEGTAVWADAIESAGGLSNDRSRSRNVESEHTDAPAGDDGSPPELTPVELIT